MSLPRQFRLSAGAILPPSCPVPASAPAQAPARTARRSRLSPGAAALLPVLLFGLPAALAQPLSEPGPTDPRGTAQEEFAQLNLEAARLEAQVQALEDENAIEILQRSYGYYIDKNLWTQAADLFSAEARLEIGGSGLYQGRASILRYFQSLGAEGPQEGILNDHMQLQPVIHVHADGTAQGRWHHFSQEAVHGESHHWGTGVYENDYVKEDGVWKIASLHLYSRMRTPYDEGWGVTALARSEPSQSAPPDQPPSVDYDNYPAVFVAPFHYASPGRPHRQSAAPTDLGASPAATPVTLETRLDELERRLGLLRDAEELERLHAIYGYYLARNQWDDLAGIFAPQGSIEIAQRGVYRGRASVRRNLDLYGQQGELEGQLHNHMQYQPIIHVAPDGQSAHIRSRAFSIMGVYGASATWMGGVYENRFVKIDGVWMFEKDQVFNTYMAPYDLGWKELPARPAPGITAANPPDEPPSVFFEMYPKAFLPPFHYANPVTGRQ